MHCPKCNGTGKLKFSYTQRYKVEYSCDYDGSVNGIIHCCESGTCPLTPFNAFSTSDLTDICMRLNLTFELDVQDRTWLSWHPSMDCLDTEANSTPLLRTTTGVQNPSELAAVVSFRDDDIKWGGIEVSWWVSLSVTNG